MVLKRYRKKKKNSAMKTPIYINEDKEPSLNIVTLTTIIKDYLILPIPNDLLNIIVRYAGGKYAQGDFIYDLNLFDNISFFQQKIETSIKNTSISNNKGIKYKCESKKLCL